MKHLLPASLSPSRNRRSPWELQSLALPNGLCQSCRGRQNNLHCVERSTRKKREQASAPRVLTLFKKKSEQSQPPASQLSWVVAVYEESNFSNCSTHRRVGGVSLCCHGPPELSRCPGGPAWVPEWHPYLSNVLSLQQMIDR
jgi:hypothetical protein